MKCGFFKLDITPPLGCRVAGYPTERIADTVIDPLYMRAVAFQSEGTVILLCCDLIGIAQTAAQDIQAYVAEYVGCKKTDVIINCTHTHTGPNLYSNYFPIEEKYAQELKHWAARCAQGALEDLKPAQFLYARSEVPGISFVRRYRMKDGSVVTNPGRRNPNILEPMNPGDNTLQLLKIIREGAGEILLVNFAVHPDVVSGCNISADYPGTVCDTLEGALPGSHVVYLNGTCGDLNHVDVNCPEWDRNSGKEHSLHMGRTIAGAVLGIYTKARPISTGSVHSGEKETVLLIKRPTQEEVDYFQQVIDHYHAGDFEWIHQQNPMNKGRHFLAFMEATSMIAASKMPATKTVWVSGASVGDVAFIGIPGEPFCEVGKQIRAASPFKVQFVMGLTNGSEGYYPTEDALSVNGYESRTTKFQAGVAERLIESGNALAQELFHAK